jgi:hypothetical protein
MSDGLSSDVGLLTPHWITSIYLIPNPKILFLQNTPKTPAKSHVKPLNHLTQYPTTT